MRRFISPSGVTTIELGHPDGPNLRVFPHKHQRDKDPFELLTHELSRSPLIFQPHTSSSRGKDGRRLVGIVGDGKKLRIRLLHPALMSFTEAMYQIEEIEMESGVRIPDELFASMLVASRGINRKVDKSKISFAATVFTSIMKRIAKETEASLQPRISQRQLDKIVQGISPRDFLVHQRAFQASGRGVDVSRLMLTWAKELWSQRWLLSGRFVGPEDQESLEALSCLAAIDLLLRRSPDISIAGARLRVDLDTAAYLYVWLQAVEFTSNAIQSEALRALLPDSKIPGNILIKMPKTFDASGQHLSLLEGMTSMFLREAEQNAFYVPFGSFRLSLPEDLKALHDAGINAFTVVADPQGLWVRILNQQYGEVFRWQSDRGLRSVMIPTGYVVLFNAVLAALWRDLCVAGEEALPEDTPAQPITSVNNFDTELVNASPAARRRSSMRRIRVLPKRRRLSLKGSHQWGTPLEHEAIRQRAHGVRGHLRRLHEGWKPSKQAKEIASEFGLSVPDGFTFVRPHVRGGKETTQSVSKTLILIPDKVTIVSQGLASLVTFLSADI